MKAKIILITITAYSVFYSQNAISQDFHLSQYDAAVQYLNPALTGIYFKDKTDYRIGADYRSQWKTVSGKPFTTSYLSYDMAQKRFGLGGYLINNHAGTGGFNTLNFMFSGAYQITDSKYGPHFLSVGLQAGILNKSFNPAKFTFDNQYSASTAGGFDGSISNEEVFNKTNILKFDANMGVFYKHIHKQNTIHPFIGLALYHVTMPDESFTDNEKLLPVRLSLHGGGDINVNDGIKISPSLLYMKQGGAYEINGGVLAFYNISDTEFDVVLGLNYRVKDAFIIQFGIKQENHIFRISYDANTSYLGKFSGNRGGIEFSLILAGKRGKSLFQF